MFEKRKPLGIDVPPEFLERSRRNQIEAVRRGDSWPTPEGAEDSEICDAFEHYLSVSTEDELHELATRLKRVGNEWSDKKLKVISRERDLVISKTDAARRAATLAAAVSFIPLNLISAVGIKFTLNYLIKTIESFVLKDTTAKSESWIEIQNHLDTLAELIEEESDNKRDETVTEFRKAA